MGTGVTINHRDLKRIRDKLNRIQKMSRKGVLLAIGAEIEDKVDQYPAATIANSPSNPSGRWYERGYGPRWKSGGRRTSENLGKSWYKKATQDKVEVGNTASYAEYVQGQKQTGFHARRGWEKLANVAKKTLPDAVELLRKEIRKLWK